MMILNTCEYRLCARTTCGGRFVSALDKFGSTTEAARVPNQGTLDPDSRPSPPLPPGGEGGVPARPPSEPPQGGMALSTTSSRRRRVTLPSVCMLLQQYSLDHKSGHAHRGRGTCTAWLFADGSATRRKPALPFHPPLCIHG